jgi:SAM-dependent methyltransferase
VKEYKRRTFELMAARAGNRVLDVGCGRGDDVLALARIVGSNGGAVGVDRSTAMLDVGRAAAREAGISAEFVEGDATSLPFGDETFDACRIDRTLEHLADPEKAVRELARVCRPGGRVVTIEPDWDTVAIDAPDLVTTRAVVAAHSDTYAQGTIGRSLRRLMVVAGLVDVRVEAIAFGADDFGLADVILGLRQAVIDALKARRVDRAAADAWWSSLERASAAGTFWATLGGSMAVGTRP